MKDLFNIPISKIGHEVLLISGDSQITTQALSSQKILDHFDVPILASDRNQEINFSLWKQVL